MKYIVTIHNEVVLFGESVSHRDASKAVRGNIVGAGFFRVLSEGNNEMKVTCWGKSVTLAIESRKQKDADCIENQMFSY